MILLNGLSMAMKKVLQAKAKKLGKEEFDYINVIVQDNMEAFR